MHNKITGAIGEAIATNYLKNKKYKIIETNYFTPLGEIDIIAKFKKTIVFVEVKTRSSLKFGSPKEAVNQTKQTHILRSAEFYLKTHNLFGKVDIRFDCVAILMTTPQDVEIEHIENIFN